MDWPRGIAVPRDVPGGFEASNCRVTCPLSIVPNASNFKGNSGKDFSKRDMMKKIQKSAALEVRYGNCEIHLRINKFAQNLHVLEMVVKAEKEGLDSCSKQVRSFTLHSARGKVRYICQRLFVLQQYVHKCFGCGHAAIERSN
jgi:hypothetical protein